MAYIAPRYFSAAELNAIMDLFRASDYGRKSIMYDGRLMRFSVHPVVEQIADGVFTCECCLVPA